jgi:cytochrome c-type biogenesis protein CcmE
MRGIVARVGGKARFIVAGLLVLAAVAYLIVSATGQSARYFVTVAELQALGAEAAGRNLTVSGAVVAESIVYDPSIPRVTFTIAHVPGDPQEVERAGGLAAVLEAAVADPDAPRLEVVYNDVKPDQLREGVQPIIRGRLGADGRFYADEMIFKCPTRYEEGVPDQSGGE